MRFQIQIFMISLMSLQALLNAEPLTITRTLPTWDRWLYPYNFTPGSRSLAPTFSGGDYRMGQAMIGFDISNEINVDLNYKILDMSIAITIGSNGVICDETQDEWASYLPEDDPNYSIDEDTGRPIALSRAFFANGYNASSFGESGPMFNGSSRNIFPADLNPKTNEPRDITYNIPDKFNPQYLAVGDPLDTNSGEVILIDNTIEFTINPEVNQIQELISDDLKDGIISLIISSLHPATGPGGDPSPPYPNFYMKESLEVEFGIVPAATLTITIEEDSEEPSIPGDTNNDGQVNVIDLLDVIAAFGSNSPSADVNSDGIVNVLDILEVISNFG